MENPVVVFVLGDRCSSGNLVYPTGWTKEGERLDGADAIRDKNCCVILLEDDQKIPQCDHANKSRDQPLPVIIHVNSGKYMATTIAETDLATWGTPVCRDIDSFSHVKGDGIFEEILELLGNPLCAESFAQNRWITNDLDLLDQLAAICQICMIDPNTDANVDSWWGLFNTLPQSEFKDKLREAKKIEWPAALKIIAARANALSSQPHA